MRRRRLLLALWVSTQAHADPCEDALALHPYMSEALIEACESTHPCDSEWQEYIMCTWLSASVDDCLEDLTEAVTCSVCDEDVIEPGEFDAVILAKPPGACAQTGEYPVTCSVSDAVHKAAYAQEEGISTKVVVCPGEYRETVDALLDPLAEAPVLVEAAMPGTASLLGSDPIVDWVPHQTSVLEFDGNLLPWSEDFSAWATTRVAVSGASYADPFGGQDATRLWAPSNTTGDHILSLVFTPADHRRLTFSAYVKADGFNAVKLALYHPNGRPSTTRYHQFSFVDGTCSTNASQIGCDGWGSEDVGNGWFRIWMTDDFDRSLNDGTESFVQARIHPVNDDGSSGFTGAGTAPGLQIYGAQVDGWELGRYRDDPGPYTATWGVADDGVRPRIVQTLRVPWSQTWGLTGEVLAPSGVTLVEPIVRRREMVFVDGESMRQELHIADLKPGSFYVEDGLTYEDNGHRADSTSDLPTPQCAFAGQCWLHLMPSGPFNDVAEVSLRQQVFGLEQASEWTVRGLRFAHGATTFNQPAARFVNTTNLHFAHNIVEFNGTGLAAAGWGTLFEGNHVRHNSLLGESVQITGAVVDEVVTHNNWRGARGKLIGAVVSGTKYSGDDISVRRSTYGHNHGHGLWFDYDCDNVHITDSLFEGNDASGVYFERHGQAQALVVERSTFVDNSAGIIIAKANGVVVADSTFDNNDVSIVMTSATSNEPDPNDAPVMDVVLRRNDHAICGTGRFYDYSDEDDPSDMTLRNGWLEGLGSVDNTFTSTSVSPGFHIKGMLPPTGTECDDVSGMSRLDLAQWRSWTQCFGTPQDP